MQETVDVHFFNNNKICQPTPGHLCITNQVINRPGVAGAVL